jgi:glycosyltransferase involved in cell wall biosynthesis
MPYFSVIIPTYNRTALLREALDSVFAQTFTDYEVIVVDDGSTDDTLQMLAGYGNRVRIFQQSNQGPGAARNLGAKHAAGDYLAFLDSDDLWFPWSLAVYAQAIRQAGNPGFIAGKPKRFTDPIEIKSANDSAIELLEFQDYLESGEEWRWWGVSSFVINRDAFEAAGRFTDEWINGEDGDLALRLGISVGFVQVLAPYTFGYREHAVSAMKDRQKTLAGTWHQVRAEQHGEYPGGETRAQERWRIITRLVRTMTLDCLSQKLRNDAWRLYLVSFRWHIVLGRWKYLVGFPIKAIISLP